LGIRSDFVNGCWLGGELDSTDATEASKIPSEGCDTVTAGGFLKLGNQSGVRACASGWAAKPKSWGISELEGRRMEATQWNDTYLYQLIDGEWVEDLNLEKDACQILGAFHCWKRMVSTVFLSLDDPAR
jgi:hypothetical protein